MIFIYSQSVTKLFVNDGKFNLCAGKIYALVTKQLTR